MSVHNPSAMNAAVDRLSEKEKLVLRLLLRGHDAKSIARELDLSVHTINERLREARRKLGVSSSREAARQLHQSEGDNALGDAPAPAPPPPAASPPTRDGRRAYRPTALIGVIAMILTLALAALTLAPQQSAPLQPGADAVETTPASAARGWLALMDEGRYADAHAGVVAQMRQSNPIDAWNRIHREVRTPMGAVLSRRLASTDDVPAGPNGLFMVRFRADFANRPGALETVTLAREEGALRVAGYTIE